MKHALWIHPVTICFTWIHPVFHLNYNTTQVLIVLKLSFFLNQKDNWIIPSIHQQIFFSEHHDYELFLLQKEFDAPNDNPNHYDIHTCENQDDILIHATNLSNIFALPQFMAQHTCEDQEPTYDSSAVPTVSQASCDHTLKPKCAHNPIDIPV